MGSSSVSTHRGLIHWQGLLLVVSLLNSWIQPSTAQVRVESMEILEGADVTLHIRHGARNPSLFLWYRGGSIDIHNNIAYLSVNQGSHVRGPPGGQVMVEDDGSLLLKNVTVNHSGMYTVMVQLQGCQKMIACGQLTVYRIVRVPTLLATKTSVIENKDAVVMSCYTNHDNIQWFFKGKSLLLTERSKMSRDHRNLTIDPVQRWDAGDYQCKASNALSSGKSARLYLRVKQE